MNVVFYVSAGVATIATAMVITRRNAAHALLFLIISLLAVALIFFVLGAPFVAALEVIIYAGAIMVLFLFVIMLLNLGQDVTAQEAAWLRPKMLIAPAILAGILIAEVGYIVTSSGYHMTTAQEVGPKQVGIALFGPYLVAVELAAMLLLAGLIGAYHLGRRESPPEPEQKN